jgi:hypothetical protein
LGKIPILISFNYVLEGFGSNNLTKAIMEALTIRGGMPKDQVVNKLMSLEHTTSMFFKTPSLVSPSKFRMIMHPSP